MVGVLHGREDGGDMIEEVWAAQREVVLASSIEHDEATIRIVGPGERQSGSPPGDEESMPA